MGKRQNAAKGFVVLLIFTMVLSMFSTTIHAITPTGEPAKAWQPVGTPGFTSSSTVWDSIVIEQGVPYIAYEDRSRMGKLTVRKFNGSSWVLVGSAGFTAGGAGHISLKFYQGVPYVAYQDTDMMTGAMKASVMKFNGSSWVAVGSLGFSEGNVDFVSFDIDDLSGTPYVAYRDNAYNGQATVKKFDGLEWVNVGPPGFSTGIATDNSLFIENGVPYLAYNDHALYSKAVVMAFNGLDWEPVGTEGFTSSSATSTSLVVYQGIPYIAFRDNANGLKASVMTFDGFEWNYLGTPGFSAGEAFSVVMTHENGKLYVAYQDRVNGKKATVKTFNGVDWETVGSGGFSAGEAHFLSIAVDNGTPYVSYNDRFYSGKATVMSYRELPPQVEPVTANPTGSMVVPGTTVALTSATPDAVIHYTMNGATPTSASPVYTGPIAITSAVTLKAIAVKAGMLDSVVMSESYTLMQPAGVPAASPAGGEVVPGATVALASSTLDAAIHYTLDGTTPTSASSLYNAPITITGAVTLKAVAVKAGMLDSSVMSESYTLMQPVSVPTASPAGGAAAPGTAVVLTSSTLDAAIHYTIDGTAPTIASPVYNGPIPITGDMTVRAIAVKAGMLNSAVMSESYTLLPPSPSGISFDKQSYEMDENSSVPMQLFVSYLEGGSDEVTSYAQYSFSPGGVAQVTSSGTLKAMNAGSTVMTAVYGDHSVSASVKVRPLVNGVRFNDQTVSLKKGESKGIALTATYSDGSKDSVAANQVAFTVMDSQVAGIDSAGTLTALGTGSTVLKAVYKTFSAELPITVTHETATADIEEALKTIEIGYAPGDSWESVTQNVFFPTIGKHNTEITWTSSNTNTLSHTGSVNRPADKDVTVIMTATVNKDGSIGQRPFLVIVKKGSVSIVNEDVSRTVPVRLGEEKTDAQQTTIVRKTLTDGTKIDKVDYDPLKAQLALNEALQQNKKVVRVVVTDLPDDKADQVAVQIPMASYTGYASGAGMDLAVETEEANVVLPSQTLQQLEAKGLDLFFNFVPIRSSTEAAQVTQRAMVDPIVTSQAVNKTVTEVSTPIEIDTNIASHEVKLVFPLSKLNAPSDPALQEAYLSGMHVYIEHSDGDIEFQKAAIERDSAGTIIGVSITINKFSIFTLLKLDDAPSGQDEEDSSTPSGGSAGSAGAATPATPATIEQKPAEPTNAEVHEPYISGYDGGLFQPEKGTTRAEFAAMLWRILKHEGEKAPAINASAYHDVQQDHWAFEAIEALRSKGIFQGVGEGQFQPDRTLTRAEFAAVVVRWKALKAAEAGRFSDANGHWAETEMNALAASGIASGYEDGLFHPDRTATRAEIVKMLNRLMSRGPLIGVAEPTWNDVAPTHWAYGDVEEASRKHAVNRLEDGSESLIK